MESIDNKQQVEQVEYVLNTIRIFMNTQMSTMSNLENKINSLEQTLNDVPKRLELIERKVSVLFKKLDCVRTMVNNLKTTNADISLISEFNEGEDMEDDGIVNIGTDFDVGKEV